MTAFPSDTPTKSDVDAEFERHRFDMWNFHVNYHLQQLTLEINENGGDAGAGQRLDNALGRQVPGGFTEQDGVELKEAAEALVDQALESFEEIYATFFDDDQQQALEHMLGKYEGVVEEFEDLLSSDHIKAFREATEHWNEPAAESFRDDFRTPLRSAIANHEDMARHLHTALVMESAAQITLRKGLLQTAKATPLVMGGTGRNLSRELGLFSLAAAAAALVIPPAGIILGYASLGAGALSMAIGDATMEFSMDNKGDASFEEMAEEIRKGLTSLAESLDEARKAAATSLDKELKEADIVFDDYSAAPPHWVPGGADWTSPAEPPPPPDYNGPI